MSKKANDEIIEVISGMVEEATDETFLRINAAVDRISNVIPSGQLLLASSNSVADWLEYIADYLELARERIANP